jgi:hypothetical protein
MTLYFNAAVDNDWGELGNWWQDQDCTIPASALPAPTDDVVILSTIELLGADRTVSTAVVENGLAFYDYELTVTNGATFFGSGYIFSDCTVNANCIFNDFSENGGIINGNVVFNDFSKNYEYNGNTQINGNAVFNDNSINYSTVNGNAVFKHNSYMEEDFSYYGYVTGDAFFYDNSYNKGGIVGGVTHFCSPSALTAQLTQASYDGTTFNGGIKYPFADILGAGLI